MNRPAADAHAALPWWSWVLPALAWVLLIAAFAHIAEGAAFAAGMGVMLVASVFASVHHAETVADRIGEPFGTLVLAVAVTVIEVALIVSVMLGAPDKQGLARDTVFAAVMITCNGLVGACLLLGGVRHHEQGFQVQGASAALAVLAALVTLTLVLPNFTISTAGPAFNSSQLAFAAVASLLLYGGFVFTQTVSHRGYFLSGPAEDDAPHPPPSAGRAALSSVLLLACLVAVVGLAKALTPAVEASIDRVGAPKAVVGIVIAAIVLMPEGLTAVRAARANRLQTSLNLSLGSALASIGLTIPTVAAVSIVLARPLDLGLGTKEEVLLSLTLLVGVITLGTGRTTLLQGLVHLIVLAAFLFFAVVP